KRSAKPTSFWLLGGAIGSGKTWTLSWLLRDGPALLATKTKEQWAVVGFPFPARGLPDRAFFESFFSSSDPLRVSIREIALSSGGLVAPKNPYTRVAKTALTNNDVWGTLTGFSTSFPRKRGRVAFPTWANAANRMGIFLEFLKTAESAGVSRL